MFFTVTLVGYAIIALGMILRDVSNNDFSLRFYDCRMRMESVVLPPALAIIDLVISGGKQDPEYLAICISMGPLILLLCPERHEKAAMSYSFIKYLCLSQLVLVLLQLVGYDIFIELKVPLSILVSQGFLAFYLVRRTNLRHSKIRKLFNNISVWHSVRDLSRYMFSLGLFMVMGIALNYGSAGPVAAVLAGLALYVVCYLRIVEDCSFMVGKDTENYIKDAIRGRLYERAGAAPDDDRRMIRMYERIKQVMETSRPYRNELLSLSEMAIMLTTNKAYLSRTINLMSGCNFRSFVNWYRIEEAKRIIKENPDIPLMDVWVECGFRNHQTFDSAFVRQCSMGPKEYQYEMRMERSMKTTSQGSE